MSKRGWIVLGTIIALVQIPLLHQLFWRADAQGAAPFTDTFERAEVGDHYTWFWDAEAPRIEDGWLKVPAVKNNPVWLTVPLPEDVAIRFDARSTASVGDLKFELFGNGRDHESGYVAIFGGWNNRISVLARQDEHGTDRKERRDLRVEAGRTYDMRIERRDGHLKWFVDGALFLEWDDPEPLTGRHHDRFAFSAWETETWFDNLRIEPL